MCTVFAFHETGHRKKKTGFREVEKNSKNGFTGRNGLNFMPDQGTGSKEETAVKDRIYIG